MQAFLWHGLDTVTDRYHPEGSLLVIAANVEAARELAKDTLKCTEYGHERDTPLLKGTEDLFTTEPDRVWPVGEASPEVFVFPDAGCC